MKNKITFSLIAGTSVLLFSCTKEVPLPSNSKDSVQENLSEMTFTSTNENVRTVLNPDGKTISWSKDDQISIFDGSGNNAFSVDAECSGIFSGSATESDCYYAVYPYNKDAAQTDTTVQYKVSHGSSWCTPNTFPKEKSIMYAKAEGNSLSFKHLSAYIKLTIPEDVDDLYEIIFFSADKVPVSGTFALTFKNDGTVSYNHLKLSEDTYNQSGISAVNSKNGENFAPGDYYIPILPANLTGGFHLKFNHRSGVPTRAHTGKAMNLVSGSVLNIGTVRKTNVFSYGNFEDNTLNSNRFSSTNDGIYSGKALGVIENPHKKEGKGNTSNYVLDDNMTKRDKGSATSGFFTISIPGTEFCNAVKDHYNTIRMKVWLGENDYYVRLCYGQDTKQKSLPSTVNGTKVSNATEYKAAVKTDAWNVFEWNTKTCWGVNSINQKSKWDIRPFEDAAGNGTKRDETNHTHTVLFDDIEFLNYK